MVGMIISAIAGAVIGGAVNGTIAAKSNQEKIAAYRSGSSSMKTAAGQYSGAEGFRKMVEKGNEYASQDAKLATELANQQTFMPQNPNSGMNAKAEMANNAMNAGETVNSAALGGLQQGMSDQNAINAAKYNAATVGAQQAMKQADIDYNVANQAAKEGMNTVSNMASTINQIRRTDNGRQVTDAKNAGQK